MSDDISFGRAAKPLRDPPPTVSVVIPALNEAHNIPHVLEHVPRGVHEVILVDGGSVDGTVEAARESYPAIRVVTQDRKGKGNALACGFEASTGDILVMLDADGSTDPREIPRFVETLVAGADFAKGSRFRPGGGSHDITPFRRAGNRALNVMVNVLFGARFSDLCYGYNAFWRDVLPVLGLSDGEPVTVHLGRQLYGDGFEIETLMNVRAASAGLCVREVASTERPRISGVSNLRAVSDGLRIARTIGHEWVRARRGGARAEGHRPARLPAPYAPNSFAEVGGQSSGGA